MKSYISKLKILVLVACAFLVSCEKLTDINRSPNSVLSEPDEYLFTNAAKWTLSESRQTLSRGQIMFTGPWSHMLAMGYAEDQYNINYDTDDENILWSDLFGTQLAQSNNLVKLTGTDGINPNPVRNTMAKMLTYISYIKITDLYGDIPYTEGGKGISENIILPKYDTQEYIYKDIIAKLKEAITVFEGATVAQGYGVADPFYAGVPSQWVKFANSFRLRLAMRMRYADPAGAATVIAECLAKPLMTSNLDNARIKNFVSTSTYLYSGWSLAMINEGSSARPSRMLIDQLKSTNDPRLPVFALPNTGGKYKGMPNGITSAARGTMQDADSISKWAPLLYAQDVPSLWLCYSEVCFLKAEAALFGIGRTASATDANSFYQDGIKAAMSQWNVAQAAIDNFIATIPAATLSGTDENKFKLISTQMWLSCITNYYEAYNVVRRTGYPVIAVRTGLETPPLNPGVTNGQLPRRIQFPASEIATNKDNYDAAIEVMGADSRLTKVWWDKK